MERKAPQHLLTAAAKTDIFIKVVTKIARTRRTAWAQDLVESKTAIAI
jgi:hypothetical protein